VADRVDDTDARGWNACPADVERMSTGRVTGTHAVNLGADARSSVTPRAHGASLCRAGECSHDRVCDPRAASPEVPRPVFSTALVSNRVRSLPAEEADAGNTRRPPRHPQTGKVDDPRSSSRRPVYPYRRSCLHVSGRRLARPRPSSQRLQRERAVLERLFAAELAFINTRRRPAENSTSRRLENAISMQRRPQRQERARVA
jgi:hypothetical protein